MRLIQSRLGQPAAVYTALAPNCFENFWRE
jgi:hypothetical protein